jgi:hypothetical protein
MKNQVLSIEQMRHLEELGVDTSKASMFYVPKIKPKDEYYLLNIKPTDLPYIPNNTPYTPTFILQDIIEVLPKQIVIVGIEDECLGERTYWLRIESNVYGWQIYYITSSDQYHCSKFVESKSLLEAAYNMLCWCAENGYLKGGNSGSH